MFGPAWTFVFPSVSGPIHEIPPVALSVSPNIAKGDPGVILQYFPSLKKGRGLAQCCHCIETPLVRAVFDDICSVLLPFYLKSAC